VSRVSEAPSTSMQRILDAIERIGNRVPHPVVIFVILMVVIIALSHLLYLMGVSVSYPPIAL
jgi:aminobenzoyl-glutamate transport protein